MFFSEENPVSVPNTRTNGRDDSDSDEDDLMIDTTIDGGEGNGDVVSGVSGDESSDSPGDVATGETDKNMLDSLAETFFQKRQSERERQEAEEKDKEEETTDDKENEEKDETDGDQENLIELDNDDVGLDAWKEILGIGEDKSGKEEEAGKEGEEGANDETGDLASKDERPEEREEVSNDDTGRNDEEEHKEVDEDLEDGEIRYQSLFFCLP